MAIHRLKHSMSAGELSPLMESRYDFNRYNNGCIKLENMVVTTQGPVTRRPGTEFIYDLADYGQSPTDKAVRFVPFIFNELQSYQLLFFRSIGEDVTVFFFFNQELLTEYSGVLKDTQTYPGATFQITFTSVGVGDEDFAELDVWLVRPSGDVQIARSDYQIARIDADSVAVIVQTAKYDIDATDAKLYSRTGTTPNPVFVVMEGGYDFDIMTFDYAQSGDILFIAQATNRPLELLRNDHLDWSQTPHAYTDPGGATPVWSQELGWPETVTFHQQRLAYGGNFTQRQKIWLSEARNFDNFEIILSDPLGAAAPIAFTMDSGTQNAIQWLTSLKALNAGTLGDEWTITGSNRDALVPGGVTTHRQTNRGSIRFEPLVVGITILFLERFGRTVNEFVYDFSTDSYNTSDVSILSKHITEHYSIIAWAYQQTPDSIVWGIREDGTLVGVTYQRQHEVIGWHRHITPGPEGSLIEDLFKAVGSIPGTAREDEVYTVVRRNVEGTFRYYVERFAEPFVGETASEGHFLDSHIHFQYDTGAPIDTFVQVDHLALRTVAVVADGVVLGEFIVAVDGRLPVDLAGYYYVLVGLNFVSEVWPTNKEAQTKEGTISGRTQRITNLDIDLYDSGSFLCGRYSKESGEKEEWVDLGSFNDDPTTQIPLYSGIKHYEFPEGFDRDSQYFIRQKDPLPLTIRAITDTVEVTR